MWVIFTAVGIAWTMRYARRVKLAPKSSITYEDDKQKRIEFAVADTSAEEDGDRIFLGSNEGGIRGDMRYVIDRFAAEYVRGFDLVHSRNYCFTERELPKIKAAGVPISFDFSDDSTDEYFEQIAPFVTYAFMSMGDAFLEDIKSKLEWVKALGPQIVCASRGSKGSVAYDGENFYEQGIKPVAPEDLKDAMAAGDSLLTAFLVTYLSKQKAGEGGADAIRESLDFAASFAAETCKVEGSWGHPLVYEN